MIFSERFGLYTKVLDGTKTETRRLSRPRVSVGKTYAAVPKMSRPAWWFYEPYEVERITDPRAFVHELHVEEAAQVGCFDTSLIPVPSAAQANRYLRDYGAVQARYRVVSIDRESLCHISSGAALREGTSGLEAFRALWDSINTKRGTRWQDNPAVWVVRFAVVDEVRGLYAQWKAQAAEVTG